MQQSRSARQAGGVDGRPRTAGRRDRPGVYGAASKLDSRGNGRRCRKGQPNLLLAQHLIRTPASSGCRPAPLTARVRCDRPASATHSITRQRRSRARRTSGRRARGRGSSRFAYEARARSGFIGCFDEHAIEDRVDADGPAAARLPAARPQTGGLHARSTATPPARCRAPARSAAPARGGSAPAVRRRRSGACGTPGRRRTCAAAAR